MKAENDLSRPRCVAMFRFSLAWLIGVVLAIALALAALVNASRGGAALLFTATLVTLLVAPLGILYRRDAKRAFWVGFALLGWGYLLCAYGPWFGRNISAELVTTKVMTYLHANTARIVEIPAIGPGFGANPPLDAPTGTPVVPLHGSGVGGGGFGVRYPYLPDTIRIGHCLTALLLALLGGRLGAYFHFTNRQNTSTSKE